MIRAVLAVAATGLLIGGCSNDKAESSDKAETVKREAGSWKNTITLEKFDVPGAPPEMKDMMQGMMTAASKMEVCLTPEMAAKENIAESMAKSQANNDCTFSKQNIAGGKFDVAAVCKDGSGQTLNLTMVGTSTATKTDVKMTVDGKGPTGGAMNMVMAISSERTSDCKPGQPTMNGSKVS